MDVDKCYFKIRKIAMMLVINGMTDAIFALDSLLNKFVTNMMKYVDKVA